MCIRQLVCMSKADIPSFWHTVCFSIWSSSQIQSSHLKWPQIPVCGTTKLETRGCLANRTSFPKLQGKPRELCVVTLNVARSSCPSHSALKTSAAQQEQQKLGASCWTLAGLQVVPALFPAAARTNRDQGHASFITSHCLPREQAYGPSSPSFPSGVWLWHEGIL